MISDVKEVKNVKTELSARVSGQTCIYLIKLLLPGFASFSGFTTFVFSVGRRVNLSFLLVGELTCLFCSSVSLVAFSI